MMNPNLPHNPLSPNNPDTKNLILALVIGTLIMGGWQYFYERPRLAAQQAAIAQQKKQAANQNASADTSGDARPPAADAQNGGYQTTLPGRETVIAAQKEDRITIRSHNLHGSISLVGARIDDLTLARYRDTLSKNSKEVVLLTPAGAKDAYFAEFGWLSGSDSLTLPDAKTRWQADAKELTPSQPVTLRYKNPQNITFIKKISLDAHYLFTVQMQVQNSSGKPITLYPYGLIQRVYDDVGHKHFAILHEGPLGVFNNTLNNKKYKTLKEDGAQQYDADNGWLGITDKYWLSALIPDATSPFKAQMQYLKRQGKDAYQVDYRAQPVTIASDATGHATQRLFAGAKEVNVLDTYRDTQGIALFDRAVDFGMFYFLTKPIFYVLNFIYGFAANFGVSILILTVFIKLLMYPLANKSFTAMSRMKLLMPKVKELQELYKDDKLKMNTAMMELYKKEKVNPMSGCLPILIQIPVFFSLYKVLFVTIEMRHAPFFGWIADLSAPDPTNIFTLLGLLQWNPPAFLHIGIWPLIMCVTMVIQQKLNPKPTDPVQAAVISYMPYMFLFMFATFPAGLVVYWAWNNTLSILQQRVIQKKIERQNAAKKTLS